MNQDMEKYHHLREYMMVGESEMKKLIRMVDSILDDVESLQNMRTSPELCLNVRDQAVRIRSILSSRLVALEDLINILRGYDIKI